jgi:predicted dehydrogenase/threonine dehydrogenase-like Zn-dependent dehydrogenase
MKQIVQNFKTGKLSQREVPTPSLASGGILVQTVNSLISTGTETSMLELARKSMLGKAKERPDQVRQVIEKVKKEGLRSTYQKVINQLDEPKPLGYSCAGIVVEVGASGGNFSVGDRVACAGAGYANHSEVNFIPKNLAVKIPENVSFEEAAYTTVGAIALQGVRQASPSIGDNVFVLGLGLLGLITVQLLKANGCNVIGTDLDPKKVEMAERLGIDFAIKGDQQKIISTVQNITDNRGVDSVIITAGTKSNEPIELSAELARQKGRVVALGVISLNVPRSIFYVKELDLRLSLSYGPGRYDPYYEERGQDYPYAYVRWTEQRNMHAILRLMAQEKLDVKSLTSHKFMFEKAEEVYRDILSGKDSYLGVLFEYNLEKKHSKFQILPDKKNRKTDEIIVVGLIGAGNYAGSMLYPELKKHEDAQILGLATGSGISAEDKARKYGAEIITTDYNVLLKEKRINTVFITTRHSLHAQQIINSLKANKHVFVEKPLALSIEDLKLINDTYENTDKLLLVGYNRRYSPLTTHLKEFFKEHDGPMNLMYRISAGFIPKDHWLQDPLEGGGRVIGEVCHFVDYLTYLTNSLPNEVFARGLSQNSEEQVLEDNINTTISFKDGSIATIVYTACGGAGMEKEYIEMFAGEKSAKLSDFKELILYSGHKSEKIKLGSQDKGQKNEIKHFIDLIKGNLTDHNYFEQIMSGSLATFKILESLKTGKSVPVNI